MKQNINLYQPAASRSGQTLSARTILAIWAVMFLVVAAQQFWLQQRHSRLEQQLQAVQFDIAGSEQNLSELTAAMMAGTDPLLDAQLNEALRELDLRETILGLVSGNTAGDIDGFSEQLQSLARQNAEGVWLTRIRISAPGARTTLEGLALSPEAVPVYLQQLSGEAALAGQSFDVFEIERSETPGEAVRFSLNRRADTQPIRLVRE